MNGFEMWPGATEARLGKSAGRDAAPTSINAASTVGGRGREGRRVDARALPAVLDLPAAAALLGLGRTTAYRLVREQCWPTPVLRLGRLIKVPTQPLLALLRGDWPADGAGVSAEELAGSGGAASERRGG